MGLFWDLMQQSQLSEQDTKTRGLERRVEDLEVEIRRTRETLHNLVCLLEEHFGHDIDGDGRIG